MSLKTEADRSQVRQIPHKQRRRAQEDDRECNLRDDQGLTDASPAPRPSSSADFAERRGRRGSEGVPGGYNSKQHAGREGGSRGEEQDSQIEVNWNLKRLRHAHRRPPGSDALYEFLDDEIRQQNTH